jgi:hypothetical protein
VTLVQVLAGFGPKYVPIYEKTVRFLRFFALDFRHRLPESSGSARISQHFPNSKLTRQPSS